MKIAIDARYLDGGYSGIGTYSEKLIVNMSRLDKENKYYVIVHSDFNRQLPLGPNFEIIKYDKRPLSMWTLFGLWKVIRDLKIDVFHSLFPLMPVFYSGKTIITLHDLQPFTDPLFSAMRNFFIESVYDVFYHWIYPLTIKKAKWVISVSNNTRDVLETLIPGAMEKTIVVHSGVEKENFCKPSDEFIKKTKEHLRVPDNYFMYIGSTRPNKNIPAMLKAYALLKEQNPEFENLKFVLCLSNVDRFYSACYDIVDRLRLEINKDIFIYKNISDEVKKALYSKASFLCLVTKYEGFGIPILEAQMMGIPVLASNSGALKEISGGAAHFVDAYDIDEIADGMKEILANSSLRNNLIEKGLKNIERFKWENTAKNVINIYNYLT